MPPGYAASWVWEVAIPPAPVHYGGAFIESAKEIAKEKKSKRAEVGPNHFAAPLGVILPLGPPLCRPNEPPGRRGLGLSNLFGIIRRSSSPPLYYTKFQPKIQRTPIFTLIIRPASPKSIDSFRRIGRRTPVGGPRRPLFSPARSSLHCQATASMPQSWQKARSCLA
jgi:hypothetical protein